jgi:hypothetical protein
VVESKKILPELPRPSEVSGPFVAPGEYTVRLKAAGTVSERTVQVQGDPEMPITDAQYREREAFLLDILKMQNRASDAAGKAQKMQQLLLNHAKELEKHSGTPDAALAEARSRADSARVRAGRIRAVRSMIYRLASAFNGNPPRQGTLYPPTKTHRELESVMVRGLKRSMGELEEVKGWTEAIHKNR